LWRGSCGSLLKAARQDEVLGKAEPSQQRGGEIIRFGKREDRADMHSADHSKRLRPLS